MTKRKIIFNIILISNISIFVLVFSVIAGLADTKTTAIREAAEYIAQKFGKKMGTEAIEAISVKIERISLKYGDDAINAVRKVGPEGIEIIENAGSHGAQAAKLLKIYGDDALLIAKDSKALTLFKNYGDDAAKAMIKYRGISEPIIENYGRLGIDAINQLNQQNARRLGMLSKDALLTQSGKSEQIIAVIKEYGNNAMDFIWRNKGALTVTAVLASFLNDPKPYIDGVKDLGKPIINLPGKAVEEISKGTNWNVVIIICCLIIVIYYLIKNKMIANKN